MAIDHPSGLPIKKPHGDFIQTDRAVHEAWAVLIGKSPIAAMAMHIITANVGDYNAFIISHDELARLISCSPRRLRDAIKLLQEGNWLEVRRIGQRGTVNAYIVNDRVAWHKARDDKRHSMVTGRIYLAEDEQPDREELGKQSPLRRLPALYPGEMQLPSGNGLPPPSSPALPGMEPDLPATQIEPKG